MLRCLERRGVAWWVCMCLFGFVVGKVVSGMLMGGVSFRV